MGRVQNGLSMIQQLTTGSVTTTVVPAPDISVSVSVMPTPAPPAPPMPPVPDATSMDGMNQAQIAKANRESSKAINAWLTDNGYNDWSCKYVDWNDPSRTKGSVWGGNIADVYTKLRLKNGQWANLFMLGPKNFDAKSVLCTTKDVRVCVSDPDGQNPRLKQDGEPVTLLTVFANAGHYFGHKEIDAATNLSCGADEPLMYRNMAVFVQIHEGEEVQLATFVENYQSTQTKAKNALLCFTPQGASFEFDNAPCGEAKMMLTEALDTATGKVKQYYMRMDRTKRGLADVGKETAEEAAQAVAEGKSCEVPMGVNHPDMKKGTGYIFVQKSIEQETTAAPYIAPNLLIGAAFKQLQLEKAQAAAEAEEVPMYTSLGAAGDAEPPPVYRSLGGAGFKREASGCPANEPPPKNVAGQGRCYRGDFACMAPALAVKKPKATSTNGITTATHVHLVVTPPNVPPTNDDVKLCIEGLLMHELSLLKGKLESRHSASMMAAGATTETLSVDAAMAIAKTIDAHAPPIVAGVPVW